MKERAPLVASQYLAEGARGSKSGHFFSPQTRKTRARRANVGPCKSPSLPGLRAIPFHSKLHSKRSQTMKRRSNHVLFMTSSTGKILLFEEEEFYPSLFLRLSVSIRPRRGIISFIVYVEDEEEEEEVFRSDGEILPMGEGGGREGGFLRMTEEFC